MLKNIFIWGTVLCSLIACNKTKENTQQKDLIKPVDQVYPLLDAANSRWFFFASACRPFGMVTLNPDTQVGGAWGSGYKYETDTIKGFSHIHGWQIAGVSVMPVVFQKNPEALLNDYYSQFDHDKEIAEVGYHKIHLNRFDVEAELTSTTRAGFHRYTFPENTNPGIVFQLAGQLGPSKIINGKLDIVDEKTLLGELTNAPTKRRPREFKVFFVVKLDTPHQGLVDGEGENKLLKFAKETQKVKMKIGISYTSYQNAAKNILKELPEWDFEAIVQDSKKQWNELLSRIKVNSNDSIQQRRFYTDLWHALQGRRIISDVNGAYPDNTGDSIKIGQLPLDEQGVPLFNHYNSDSFWGAQWTLNTLWGLVYPEIYEEFVQSLMIYYKDGGLMPRGPSGGNYTYVMTGASATPFVVSAYQKDIIKENSESIYEALKKNHMPGGIMAKSGYEHQTFKGGALEHYIKNGYVPYPVPEGDFGYHQDGASLTLEYAYQDWTLAQMAKALNKQEDYEYFLNRSKNYQNQFDSTSGWMRPKDINGAWRESFDPYEYEHGFNESNGAQSTWFVGHDIAGLAELMGGKQKATQKLNQQFEEASKQGFTAGTSHERGEDPSRAKIPINYGNQPSIQTAFVFNYLDRPDLTQKWASEVAQTAFGGLSTNTGYNGDEDQGLMGALAVLMKLGIFQMNGGTEANPIYEFSSPAFDQVEIQLMNGNNLIIEKKGEGVLVKRITFNGQDIPEMGIRHQQFMKGGKLTFEMK